MSSLNCHSNATESASNNSYSLTSIPTSSKSSLFNASSGFSQNSIVPPGKSNFPSYGPLDFFISNILPSDIIKP